MRVYKDLFFFFFLNECCSDSGWALVLDQLESSAQTGLRSVLKSRLWQDLQSHLVVSVGIHVIRNFACRFHNRFKLVSQIYHLDQQKPAWFESDFCVSCASFITTPLTVDNGPLLPLFPSNNEINQHLKLTYFLVCVSLMISLSFSVLRNVLWPQHRDA